MVGHIQSTTQSGDCPVFDNSCAVVPSKDPVGLFTSTPTDPATDRLGGVSGATGSIPGGRAWEPDDRTASVPCGQKGDMAGRTHTTVNSIVAARLVSPALLFLITLINTIVRSSPFLLNRICRVINRGNRGSEARGATVLLSGSERDPHVPGESAFRPGPAPLPSHKTDGACQRASLLGWLRLEGCPGSRSRRGTVKGRIGLDDGFAASRQAAHARFEKASRSMPPRAEVGTLRIGSDKPCQNPDGVPGGSEFHVAWAKGLQILGVDVKAGGRGVPASP